MTAVPDPRFRDQLAEPTREDRAVAAGLVRRARAAMSDDERDAVVDAVAREISSERAAEVEARVQAAEAQAQELAQHILAMRVELDTQAAELARVQAAANQRAADFYRAENAEERDEGICRTCLAPIWNEGGTVRHIKRAEGWSDRIERGGDSLVCFKAIDYRHVPLTGREAAIYDRAAALAQPAPGNRP